MQAFTNDLGVDPLAGISPITSQSESSEIVEILEELLVQSIHLRDLYKNARLQSADVQFRRLREFFDGHYQEQIRLVDVLLDRIRTLNGAGRVFAGDFLRRAQFSQLLRGRASITRLLEDLVDAHESALSAAQPALVGEGPVNPAWTRDFAVDQVVLSNDQQLSDVKEHLLHRERTLQTQPICEC
jgi:starvation-inducible DNA-binding protein